MSLMSLRKSPSVKDIISKTKKLQKPASKVKAGNSLITKIQNICQQVQDRLGKYKEEFQLIQTIEDLEKYIDASIANNIISIDTETTGLDPFTDKIVGACIYTYGQKPAYVPINHISYISNNRLDGQLTEEEVAKQFQRLISAKTKIIMFNAKFDIRVIRHQLGVYLTPDWCGFIAGKCLKENEEEGNLKYLWKKYCSKDKDEAHFTFDKMFEGIKFNLIPITTAYLYAAKDALMTMDLYDFQKPYLTETDEKCIKAGLVNVAKLYNEIELPIVNAVADIEDVGISLDLEYTNKISAEYNQKLKEQEKRFHEKLEDYRDQINAYMSTTVETKIENPLNISSPTQLAELFYDVLKLPSVSKKQPRGTGEDVLKALDHPLSKLILDYRGSFKLVNTYIDKMPKILNPKTGKIHCSFNQYGADCVTGDTIIPNLQFPGTTIREICENNIINMKSGVYYPLEITIFNRYGELESTSHCVKYKDESITRITFEDNSTISGTYNHPILMADNVFKELQYINIGDKVKSAKGDNLQVIDIQFDTSDVYDFKVPQTHSFVSNNVISHNTGRFSCIAAGSMISCPSGDKKIEDIKPGDYVYSYTEDGKLVLNKVLNNWFTGNRKCVKLSWISKYNHSLKGELICTPEHLIKTTKGWIEAQNLDKSHSIYYVHRKLNKNSVSLSGQHGQGNKEEHAWIKQNFFNAAKGTHIHHKDRNRLNNDPSNLQIVTAKEHANIHRNLKNGYCGAYDFTKEELISKCKQVNWDIHKIDHDYESLKHWLKNYKINYIKEYSDCYNTRPTTMRSSGKSFKYKSLPLIKENLLYALELADYNVDEAASYFGKNSDKFVTYCDKFKLLPNHNVIKIEYLDDLYSVYDLEVENAHCFIANELCVHNSSNPNLQNIPSHEKSIRRTFTGSRKAEIAVTDELKLLKFDLVKTLRGEVLSQDLVVGDTIVADKQAVISEITSHLNTIKIKLTEDINSKISVKRSYILIGSDYSQQEPKITADLSNDEHFINQCASGRDAYAIIASVAFNKPYEDCLEFYLDENGNKTDRINKEGKERRSVAKVLLLGICYGKTMKSIAEDLKVSEEKATEIYNAVLTNIPGLKRFMEESEQMAKQLGYVETKWGRRRHIPEMQLERYEIKSVGTKSFDPFFDSAELGVIDETEILKQKYKTDLEEAKFFQQKQKIIVNAEKDGFKVKENSKKIDDAKRLCVNSRIQGSAADQTKIAIQNLYKNEELKELGWRTCLLVHDEIIGEAPLVNAKRCGELLVECMIDAARDLRTGAACDATYVFSWYDDQFGLDVKIESLSQKELEDLIMERLKLD